MSQLGLGKSDSQPRCFERGCVLVELLRSSPQAGLLLGFLLAASIFRRFHRETLGLLPVTVSPLLLIDISRGTRVA